jgi:hypothetical protein
MTKKPVVPTHETISKAGDALEITGIIISTLCLVVGALTLFTSGNGVPFIGITFGLLLMITGYTKKTSAATMAMFIIATDKNEREIANKKSADE